MGEHHGELEIRKDPFGTTPDGQEVDVYTFTNGRVTISMVTWGATIQRVETPDRRGRTTNISLGFDNLPAGSRLRVEMRRDLQVGRAVQREDTRNRKRQIQRLFHGNL